MKSEVEQSPQSSATYPLLAQHKNGDVVLFKEAGKGMIVKGTEPNSLGVYFEQFNMGDFTVFNGVLKLSN